MFKGLQILDPKICVMVDRHNNNNKNQELSFKWNWKILKPCLSALLLISPRSKIYVETSSEKNILKLKYKDF